MFRRKPLPSRTQADGAPLDRLLDRRPLPPRCPDVAPAVLARIQTQRIQALGWRRWLARPLWTASAWGLAGAMAGFLFLALLGTLQVSRMDSSADTELASAPLLTEDLAILTQLDELPEGGDFR